MQAKIRLNAGKVWIEIDASNVKEAMKCASEYVEVFGEQACGQCQGTDLRCQHREHDGHDYYSLKCQSCGAQLDFGQHKTGGTLFAKRKLASGEWDNQHGGWYKWKDRQADSGF